MTQPPTAAAIPLRRRLLLSSDYDDTLFGSRSDPRHTDASEAFARVFPRLRHPSCGSPARLAINTGRTLSLFAAHPDAEQRLNALGLEPDVLIAGVGTRVYWKRQGAWVEDTAWTAAVGEGWTPHLARSAVERALAASAALREARFQREEELHDHKLTVSFEGDDEAAAKLCAEITKLFAEVGASREPPRLVTGPCGGGGGSRGRRRYIDVLPAPAGKGNAMLFVAQALGYEKHEVATAGDSHNDLCMLRHGHQARAILVGNGHPDVRSALSSSSLSHVWLAPEGCVGAAAVLKGLTCAGGDGDDDAGWVAAEAVEVAFRGLAAAASEIGGA
jgi:HAD superfamily hydrolase (TIGR01484 family)